MLKLTGEISSDDIVKAKVQEVRGDTSGGASANCVRDIFIAFFRVGRGFEQRQAL
jgi:hypothetical protein